MYLLSDQRFGRAVALGALDADALPQPLSPPSTIGPLANPAAICLDGLGRVHIADAGNGRVVSFALATGTWTSFGAGRLGAVTGVTADASGRIHAATGQKLVRADGVDGAGLVELPLPAGARPVAVAIANGDRLAVVDAATRAVLLGDTTGSSWTAHPLPAGSKPIAIAARASGGVLVADLSGRRIVALDLAGSATTLIEAADGLVAPIAAVDDPPGITVADAGAGWIRRFLPVDGRWVAADFVRGRRADGSWRFDRVGGLTLGALS